MHLSKSFPLKAARHIGAHLTVLAALTLMNGIGLGQTPAPVKVNPETGTPVQSNRPRPQRPIDTPYAKAALATMHAPLDKLTPVTDEMLRNPPPGDWLNWRRTDNGWGYSPLAQINRTNVKELKVAWTFSMDSSDDDTVTETTPIVHDGVHVSVELRGDDRRDMMPKTGTLLWKFTWDLPADYPHWRYRASTGRSVASQLAATSLLWVRSICTSSHWISRPARRCGMS